MSQPDTEIWVIDTSSIIDVRQKFPKPKHEVIFRSMTDMVNGGALVYPGQVIDELERYASQNRNPKKPDLPYKWAKANGDHATRFDLPFSYVQAVMAHPQACKVIDPEKAGAEEADPYVLALALRLQEARPVRVVSQERKDMPDKISLATACGYFRLVCMTVEAFLYDQGIVTPN